VGFKILSNKFIVLLKLYGLQNIAYIQQFGLVYYMLELKIFYKKNIRSIFLSKFCFKHNKSIFKRLKINYYLVIKLKEKNKILFFFIILLLMIGSLPTILKSKRNLKIMAQDEFLAFEYNIRFLGCFKFLNLYLPMSDIVKNLFFKFNQYEYRLTIKYFPIINELDKTCESNVILLDYIQDYKLVLKFKTFYKDWYLSESIIRCMRIPLISNNRFGQ
jgi:hypothetical protein